MSRYTGNRFDPDRRSKSPHDRSPYGDRGLQYSDDRRRPPLDSRGNSSAFAPGREPLSGIQPPRAPKAMGDAPNGPRGGVYPGDLRGGRGRGASRGRWRDDGRDGGRDREDYRDRPHFRDERSRERERPHDRDRDRDWPPRDQRDRMDFSRPRRPPSPLRPRSPPPPGRDFRDLRDTPLGIDPERAGRGSRDGPLSAGSSNSDSMFPPSSYRGGFGRGGGRGGGGGGGGPPNGPGGGRGRPDWERPGGRDRGNFYDDRDRYPRSRSQESRRGREPDDRERRDARYPDVARDLRDDRDLREREPREREPPPRPKPDRASNESQPPAKDVSPPPLAPSAPAFGSVPSRQPAASEIQSLTGKPPPTGPRALTEERPISAASAIAIDRAPPTGPSKKTLLPDGGPPIPVGPRAQQQRGSKQWVNPSLTTKKPQESPKTPRLQNFPGQPGRPSSGFSSYADHHRDFDKRPRSPGARSDSHVSSVDRFGPHVATGANEIAIKSERGSLSARPSVDREIRTAPHSTEAEKPAAEDQPSRDLEDRHNEQPTDAGKVDQSAILEKEKAAVEPPVVEKPPENPPAQITPPTETRPTYLTIPSCRVQLPAREPSAPVSDESSESDEEDMDVYFEQEISKKEAELQRLQDAREKVPIRIVRRYAVALHRAITIVLNETPSLAQVAGPIPSDFTFPRPPPTKTPVEVEMADVEATPGVPPDTEMPDAPTPAVMPEEEPPAPAEEEPPLSPVPARKTEAEDTPAPPPEPQPKIEEMDIESSALPEVPPVVEETKPEEEVPLPVPPVAETTETLPPAPRSPSIPRPPTAEEPLPDLAQPLEQEAEKSSASSGVESEDKTEEDSASVCGSAEVARDSSATPPTEDLPVYNVKPWYKSRRVRQLAKESPEFSEFLLNHMRDQAARVSQLQQELRDKYAKDYEAYLSFTKSDDPAAVKSREYFAGVSTSSGKSGGSDSKPEGGRRAASRFSTELDLEAAIKESIREHQERQEREERAQKEKYRTEKEAVIPEMYWTEEEKERAKFYDTSGLLPLEKLVATYQVVPQHINFTQEEAEKFEKAYLEAPKQWGKISKELGDRDPGTCIMYYYAMKRELNLKEKLKKQPRRRKKGRGKQRSSALVSELGNTEAEGEDNNNQDNGENGERRRPPRRAAAPVWGNKDNKDNSNNNSNNEATPAADSEGTPAPTASRRRGATATGANEKNEAGVEKTESKRGGRKPRQNKADKEKEAAAKTPKQIAQAPGSTPTLAVPAKPGRSRANSKAQQAQQDWSSAPQTPVDLAARRPLPFEAPHGAMQPPPLVPVHQAAIASPDRPAPQSVPSAISEVMAPPSLRPEPPPPPTSGATFEIPQPSAGPERNRTPQQASSYWSVPETTDFPGLLRAFGTDWAKIANHMKTKTATMVKNYYVRQTKEGGKPEWEQIAMEADAKAQRGEKRPAPPTPTQGPRKRYDMSTAAQRPLAAAEPEDGLLTKVEPQSNQPSFSRFQVPIAPQASPASHQHAQQSQPMAAPITSTSAPGQPTSGTMGAQVMSPRTHPLRPPGPSYQYQEREPEPPMQQALSQQQQQSLRMSQKPPVPATASAQPIPEPAAPRPSSWATDLSQQFSLLPKGNESRSVRPGLDLTRRESPRPVERVAPPPLRMKQEPEPPAPHRVEAYQQPYQATPQRGLGGRQEPAPLSRPPEPPRASIPVSQPYAPPVHSQPMRVMLNEPVSSSHMPPPRDDRAMPPAQRPMQDPYGQGPPVSAPSAPPPPPATSQPPPAPRTEGRKVNIMSLLNDDEPPAPKRPVEAPPPPGRSTPGPQPMARQPPPQPPAPMPPRREVDSTYQYGRSPAPPPTTAAIPPLKPYQTQSPQPHHVRVPSSGVQAVDSEREYYSRQYGNQHALSATNSPQLQHTHYPPHGSHMQQQAQQQQTSQMGYQSQQQAYQSYQQPQHGLHSASPGPQYAPQPSRREAPPPRESWTQQPQQQQQQQAPPQQPALQPPHHHREPSHHHREPSHHRGSSQSGWPTHAAPAKPQPAVPAQSPWGSQHGSVQVKPPVSSSLPPQSQPHHAWASSGPGQPQPNPIGLRDPPGPPSYEHQPPPSHHRHHHTSSISSRYGGMPHPSEQQAPPPQQQPPPSQPMSQYPPPYGNPGGPMASSREPNPRSYTPVSAGGYDPRGPPPPPPQQGPPSQQGQVPPQHPYHQHHPHQHQGYMPPPHDAIREPQMRDMRGGPPDLRDTSGASILGRQLRPGPPEQEGYDSRGGLGGGQGSGERRRY